ncbi:3(2),5-bisphosphate nucleotidase HAL2 [Tricholoma matsutake]|nr:3(2),5-bisphosphate nucleotidase HAL2 [Tricholoma matsutake 945]
MSLSFATEKQVAVAAVRRACWLTSSVFNRLVKNETLTKDDKSPVTVGDYSAQAVISIILQHAFPDDPIVGEEDAAELRAEAGEGLRVRARIVELANEALTGELGLGDNVDWGIGPGQEKTPAALLDAIDRGNHAGGGSGRMWTIDPIDGTKGFLRGEQYAVCLSLIVDAQVKVGVIGCPNLPVDPDNSDSGRGCIFVAVRGHGAEQISISGANPTPLMIPSISTGNLSFLESVEAAHSSHSFNDRVSSLLGITGSPIRMDSQAKYGCLARGEGGAYLRMPTGVGYREKIWDHAPGSILVEEAGGIVTDSRGEPLDFGLGRTLGENYGVVAAGKAVHVSVLEAVQRAVAEAKM